MCYGVRDILRQVDYAMRVNDQQFTRSLRMFACVTACVLNGCRRHHQQLCGSFVELSHGRDTKWVHTYIVV